MMGEPIMKSATIMNNIISYQRGCRTANYYFNITVSGASHIPKILEST